MLLIKEKKNFICMLVHTGVNYGGGYVTPPPEIINVTPLTP